MTTKEWVETIQREDKEDLARLTQELRDMTVGPLVDLLYSLGEGELPSINGFCGIMVAPSFGVYVTFPSRPKVRIDSETKDLAAIANLSERAPAYILWTARRHKGAARDMAFRCDDLAAFLEMGRRYARNQPTNSKDSVELLAPAELALCE